MECAGVFRKLVMGNLASWEWEEGRQHSGWENLVGHKENFLALDTKVEERGDRKLPRGCHKREIVPHQSPNVWQGAWATDRCPFRPHLIITVVAYKGRAQAVVQCWIVSA